ncbi:hypothetical protein DVDV_3955 [Desulfovibrio sp. DV]|nr:hypothetical protein DVDV_3955 [Desulfovibrio sp. DV]
MVKGKNEDRAAARTTGGHLPGPLGGEGAAKKTGKPFC